MDITHHYIEQGSGFPLILLHGNGENSGYFSHQIGEFSRHYHVYALDTRGHGNTPRGDKPFTIRQFADDLRAFMDEHNIQRANILGFSDGGNIALIFAMKYPNRVHKLIVDGANLKPEGVKRNVQRPIELGYKMARAFAGKSPKARQNAEMLGLMVHDPNIETEELSAVTAKTLVMAGTKDMIKREHTELIAASIPGAALAFIEGDHFIAGKNPAAFNACVLKFLREEGATP